VKERAAVGTAAAALVLLIAYYGCSRAIHPPPPPGAIRNGESVEELQRKEEARGIRQGMHQLNREMTLYEESWMLSVKRRHTDWSQEKLKYNLYVLLRKWEKGNYSSIDKTIGEMYDMGSAIYKDSLALDDYRDIASSRWHIQNILYGKHKQLYKRLELIDKINAGDDWRWMYGASDF